MYINKNVIQSFEQLKFDGAVESLISYYLNNSEYVLSELKKSLDLSEVGSVQMWAKGWRETNLCVGADSLARMLQELEIKCERQHRVESVLEELNQAILKIEQEYAGTKSELLEMMRVRH